MKIFLSHDSTMKLLPHTWLEKSIDRRVTAWCQKNRWTQLRINAEGLWVAIPPGETEHMEVPPVAYVSQSQLKLSFIRPYIPLLVILVVMVGGYVDVSSQLKTARQEQQNIQQQLQQMNQELQGLKQKRSTQ
jgi:hypothetical protein